MDFRSCYKSPEVMNHYCLKHFLTLVLGDQQCFRNNSTQIGQFVKILINKTTNIYDVSWSCRSNMQPSVEIIRFDLQIKYRLQFVDYRIFISYPTSNTDYKYSGGTLDVSQKCSRERNWYLKTFRAWSYSRTQGCIIPDDTSAPVDSHLLKRPRKS